MLKKELREKEEIRKEREKRRMENQLRLEKSRISHRKVVEKVGVTRSRPDFWAKWTGT